jgi:hypothetical protein
MGGMWSGWANRAGRGRELAGWIILVLGVGALQLPALGRMAVHGVDIVQFELMWTSSEAVRLTALLGADGLAAARQQLYLDFAYLVLYGIAISGACALVGARAARRGHPALAEAGQAFAVVALAAAACDFAENSALLAVTFGHTAQPWPGAASAFAASKFLLLAVALLYIAVGLLATLSNRSASVRAVDAAIDDADST